MPGGFYEESFSLEIFPFYPQHHIRYTTNGNRPTAASTLYTEPLLLDESLYSTSDIYTIQISPDYLVYVPDSIQHCIVIRAAVFDQNENCVSEVATNSYFIHSLGCDTHGMPAVSLCADSLDLFDYEQGIFVPGIHFNPLDENWTGNYYQSGDQWERPSNIEFYELDNQGINQQAGLRTHGGNGRRFQQKCVKIYAREVYGKKRFEHRFFETIPQNSFKHLVLKPFVASWSQTGESDHICNQIASQLNVESLASRPVVVYLNGEYWGVYYIHERPDERFLEDHLGVDIDHVNLINSWAGMVDHGSNTHFLELYNWFETADLTNPDNYAYAASKMDIDNFIDYQILELFCENRDWPANNMRCWQEGDGRWRWIFYDGDACLHWLSYTAFDNAVYEGDETWPSSELATLFFRRLLENPTFKSQFSNRFHELLGTAFDYSVTGPIFTAIRATLEPEIPFQSYRFNYPESVENWVTDNGHTNWFLYNRTVDILEHLEQLENFISVSAIQTPPFALYPNPFQDRITIGVYSEQSELMPYWIYDIYGRQTVSQMLSLQPGYNKITLDISLPKGVYLLKVNDRVTKIIKQ